MMYFAPQGSKRDPKSHENINSTVAQISSPTTGMVHSAGPQTMVITQNVPMQQQVRGSQINIYTTSGSFILHLLLGLCWDEV